MRIANVEVGHPDTSPSKPSHMHGVRMGNAPDPLRHEPGLDQRPDGRLIVSGRRSTGINARNREPIDPRSPRLTPA
jgi:hypothetical protein